MNTRYSGLRMIALLTRLNGGFLEASPVRRTDLSGGKKGARIIQIGYGSSNSFSREFSGDFRLRRGGNRIETRLTHSQGEWADIPVRSGCGIPAAHRSLIQLLRAVVSFVAGYSLIDVTTPAPTVLPPSRIAKR